MRFEVGLASLILGVAILAAIVLLVLALFVASHPLWLPLLKHPVAVGPVDGGPPVTWHIQSRPRMVTRGEPVLEVSNADLVLPSLAETEPGRSGKMSDTAVPSVTPVPLSQTMPTLTPLPRPTPQAGPLQGWPVHGQISQGFGCSVYYSGIPGPGCPAESPWFHDGLDLAAPLGQTVRATLTGTVIFAGADGSGPACGDYRGYGLGVVIETGDGWQALYAHLARIDVSTGQTVMPETIMGTVGETGCVSGPHLHFGLRHQGTLVDPKEYMLLE
jgi:murein DD-endopeptidase MepM/ murein hydrolase activator NlpD